MSYIRAILLGVVVAILIPGGWTWRDLVCGVLLILAFSLTDWIAEDTAKKAVAGGFKRLSSRLAGVRR